MHKLISLNQSTLLKVRFLIDGVVALIELVGMVKKRKNLCFIFKVDFEKAYDLVSWSFLDYMLE